MSEKKQPIRVGNGKKRKETWLTASICIDKLDGHIYEFNGKRYVNLNINIKTEPDQYGKDVEISINEYKANNFQVKPQPISKVSMNTEIINKNSFDDEMPF